MCLFSSLPFLKSSSAPPFPPSEYQCLHTCFYKVQFKLEERHISCTSGGWQRTCILRAGVLAALVMSGRPVPVCSLVLTSGRPLCWLVSSPCEMMSASNLRKKTHACSRQVLGTAGRNLRWPQDPRPGNCDLDVISEMWLCWVTWLTLRMRFSLVGVS